MGVSSALTCALLSLLVILLNVPSRRADVFTSSVKMVDLASSEADLLKAVSPYVQRKAATVGVSFSVTSETIDDSLLRLVIIIASGRWSLYGRRVVFCHE